MDSLDEIWKIADELKPVEITESVHTIDDNACKHDKTIIDHQLGDITCIECGAVVGKYHSSAGEWNNYKDDSGNYAKTTQRGEAYTDDNPYSIGGSICGIFKNNKSLGAKLHLQQCFSHKQRTFWQISQIFENIAGKYNLKADILSTAKQMWHICMESGKLTRASVRDGLIASCLYYSCIYNKVPFTRNDILRFFEIDMKTLTKGEKVFYTIIENHPVFRSLTKESINIEENDSFVRYCNILGLEWKVAMLCNEIFEKNKLYLSAVTPKSATCGVIVHVVKKKLDLKVPSKTEISKVINVCTPTVNKVLAILEKHDI
jgi:transcription initiation factor TFIIIB Brf1 subunit/transcription initiation factor TFIIB